MDKKPRKIRKEKPLLVKLTYRQVELDATAEQELADAFAILFDEVVRRRRLGAKECPQEDIDS